MGMNDDRLSESEHAEMRDVLLAGTQRIRPAGAHRAQLIAGAIALVLVGGISGGAVTTAALLNASTATPPVSTPVPSQSPATPTPTLTPTPSPTSSAPAVPPEGVVVFGGDCSGTLLDEEVTAVAGMDMGRSDYRWRTGGNDVLGGIDCVWVSKEVYLAATVHLYAYPERVVAESVRAAAANGCRPMDGDDPRIECTAVGVVNGTWMLVRAVGEEAAVTEAGVAGLHASAAGRLAGLPTPHPATRSDEWWAAPDCAQLVAAIEPAVYGYERVALLEPQYSVGRPGDVPWAIPELAGATFGCDFHFTAGSGEETRGEVITLHVVPGGAMTFPTAVAAEHSKTVTVVGAQAAVIAPGLDRYEGSGAVIVATDGVNMLLVTPDWVYETSKAAPLASALLALMHP